MPSTPKPPSPFYKALLFAALPIALLYTLYRSLKDGGIRYFSQRIGFNFKAQGKSVVLIHCASVGEVNAAKSLLFELARTNPELSFTISTNTPTGAQIVGNFQIAKLSHVYLPLDYKISIRSLLNNIKPICILIFETEIWPNLIFQAKKNNIPIAIINARLSPKTTNVNSLVAAEYRRSLKNLTLLLTRSTQDSNEYLKLGADKFSTHTVGNLKFANYFTSRTNLPCTTIKRPFFLAASTHNDEELQIVEHIEILKRKNYLLVIAPRYPERSAQLKQKFKELKLKVALRSKKEVISNDTDVYIVDTLGELDMYYNEAALVFVGGSLIQRGGHNILEPANYGKCIIVGPYTENFSQEINELLKVNGIIQVKDSQDLAIKLVRLLNNDEDKLKYGENAQKFIAEKKDILKSYMTYIQPLIRY